MHDSENSTYSFPNLFKHVFLVVLVIVSMCHGDLTSASILAATTRPPVNNAIK